MLRATVFHSVFKYIVRGDKRREYSVGGQYQHQVLEVQPTSFCHSFCSRIAAKAPMPGLLLFEFLSCQVCRDLPRVSITYHSTIVCHIVCQVFLHLQVNAGRLRFRCLGALWSWSHGTLWSRTMVNWRERHSLLNPCFLLGFCIALFRVALVLSRASWAF